MNNLRGIKKKEKMIDIKVIDNFLTKEQHQKIYRELNGDSFFFPWYYSDWVNDRKDPKVNFQFCHTFYNIIPKLEASHYYYLIEPIILKLRMTAITKIKANLLLKTKKPVAFGYHTDYPWKHKWWTALYYVNSNNGKTLFEKNKKGVVSKENRLLIFDGRLKHTGTTPTDSKKRVLINFNFFSEDMGKL